MAAVLGGRMREAHTHEDSLFVQRTLRAKAKNRIDAR